MDRDKLRKEVEREREPLDPHHIWPSARFYRLKADVEDYDQLCARIVAFWLCSKPLRSPLC